MSKNRNLSGGLFAPRKPQPLTVRETTLSAQIAAYLDARRIYNDRLNCGTARSPNGDWLHLCKAGTPDRLAIVRGFAVFIEVKMFGEKPTPEQVDRHVELRRAGSIVLIVDSFDRFKWEFEAVRGNIEIFDCKEETSR